MQDFWQFARLAVSRDVFGEWGNLALILSSRGFSENL
jgi:hypothetical protein